MSSVYFIQPLTVWEDQQFFKVGFVCEPVQEKGRAIAFFPKSNPNSKIYAMLFRQIALKWQTQNNSKYLKNSTQYDKVTT